MNARPCGIMRRAKLRWPRSESNCRLVQDGAMRKLEMRRQIRLSFSMGRGAWNELVSSVMPKNSSEVDGPSVFSADSGTPRSANTAVSVAMPDAGGEEGGLMSRKSSKR